MIQARTTDGTFILGVDAENVRRLIQGKPIVVDLSTLGGTDRLMLVYGMTAQDILNELEKASGQPLPPVTPINGSKLQ